MWPPDVLMVSRGLSPGHGFQCKTIETTASVQSDIADVATAVRVFAFQFPILAGQCGCVQIGKKRGMGVMRTARWWWVGVLLLCAPLTWVSAQERTIAYIVSDQRIPFWDIMRRGVEAKARSLGYHVQVFSADNEARRELELTAVALRGKVDGIVLSPTNSSAAVTVLKLAGAAGVPVVIADIGSEGGEYVSYIASDNFEGSYQLGRLLVDALRVRQWQDGRVGIIAIPQRRANGRARTAGFLKAMDEAGIKGSDIRQQVDFSYDETFAFATELLNQHEDLRAIWLQGSDRYQAALDAIEAAGRTDQVLLLCFDAEPEFMELIPQGVLVAAGMQQPFRMGEDAVAALDAHLQGQSVPDTVLTPVLAVSAGNIDELQPLIRRNVLGLTAP